MHWMPSHTSKESLGINLKVSGDHKSALVAPIDWRANRLADLAAKAAIKAYRLDKVSDRTLKTTKNLCKEILALLAQVTLTANTVCLNVWEGDKIVKKVCRDSTGIIRSSRNGVRKKGKTEHFAAGGTPSAKQKGSAKPPPTVQVTLKEKLPQPAKKRKRPPPLSILRRRITAALQERSDQYTSERMANNTYLQTAPPAWKETVFQRIREKIRGTGSAKAAQLA